MLLQSGAVSRELSFGPGAPAASSDQENGGNQVQHVESLGSWLGQGRADASRRPSVKLSGQLQLLACG